MKEQQGREMNANPWSRLTAGLAKSSGRARTSVVSIVKDLPTSGTFDMSVERSSGGGDARLRRIFERVTAAIAITDMTGRFQQCNPAYCALLGYSEEELREIAFDAIVHPEDRDANLGEIHRLQVGDVPFFEIENRYVRKDGEAVWVHKFVFLLYDEAGIPAHLIAMVTDLTSHRAKQTSQERPSHLAIFVAHAPAAIAMFDQDMRYLEASRRYLSVFALPADGTLIGRSYDEVFHALPADWRDAMARVLRGERAAGEETAFSHADGRTDWLRWCMTPWRHADESIGGVMLWCEVITAHVEARRARGGARAAARQ